jgi:hypothetical protein
LWILECNILPPAWISSAGIFMVYIRKNCGLEKISLKILMLQRTVFSYVINLSSCVYIWICILATPEWLDGFYYLVFRSLSIIGQCQVNLSILAPKIGALQVCP